MPTIKSESSCYQEDPKPVVIHTVKQSYTRYNGSLTRTTSKKRWKRSPGMHGNQRARDLKPLGIFPFSSIINTIPKLSTVYIMYYCPGFLLSLSLFLFLSFPACLVSLAIFPLFFCLMAKQICCQAILWSGFTWPLHSSEVSMLFIYWQHRLIVILDSDPGREAVLFVGKIAGGRKRRKKEMGGWGQ